MTQEVPDGRALIPGFVDDPALGYVHIDLAAATARYRRRRRDERGKSATDAQIVQWVAAATHGLAFRFGTDLDAEVDHLQYAELRAKRQRSEPQAGELLNQVSSHAQRRDWRFRHLAGIGALVLLNKPVSEVLGTGRARLDLGETQGEDDAEPTFLQYIALAIERGEAAALDDVVRWMRQRARSGPKEQDWPTILRAYRYTAAALGELRRRWNDGLTADVRDEALRTQLEAAGLDVEAVVEQGSRSDLKVARRLVSRRFQVTPNTIAKMWKKRATVLPSGDRLLEQGTDPAE
jgi:hypothetical protein